MSTDRKIRFTKGGDVVEATILSDGTVRIDVQGAISFANHGNAEDAIRAVEVAAGGQTEIQSHGHAHVHEHAHEGFGHHSH